MAVEAPLAWDAPIHEAARVLARDAAGPGIAPRAMQLSVGDCRITIEPLEGGVASWTARAPLPGDIAMNRGLWHGVLLSANLGLMRHGSLAFGLEEADSVVLVSQLFVEPGMPQAAARQLQCLCDVWRLAQGLCHAPLHSASASPGLAGYLIPPHHETEPERQARQERAGRCLMESLETMGLPPTEAGRIAAARRMHWAEVDIRFDSARHGHSLLLYIRLRDARLDGPPEAALRWTGRLMSELGIAIGRGARGHQLMAHWPCDSREPRDFGSYLSAFVELPAALLADRL